MIWKNVIFVILKKNWNFRKKNRVIDWLKFSIYHFSWIITFLWYFVGVSRWYIPSLSEESHYPKKKGYFYFIFK